jgi:hypothetical protein
VQAGGGRAAGVPRRQRADGGSAGDGLPRADRCLHRLVRRPQATGVIDADHRPPGHHAREHDRAVAGGQHRCADGRAQIDAAMTRGVGVRQRVEQAGDRARTVERQHPQRRRSGGGHRRRARRSSGGRGHRRHQDGGGQQRGEKAGGHASRLGPGAALRQRPGPGCGRPEHGGRPVSALAYAVRCGPFRRVDFARPPPAASGGAVATSVPAGNRRECGAAGRQGGAPPGARGNRIARPLAARRQERLQWQSSA